MFGDARKRRKKMFQDTAQVKALVQPVWHCAPRPKPILACARSRTWLWSPPLLGGLIDCVARNFNSVRERVKKWLAVGEESLISFGEACSQGSLYFNNIQF